MKITSVEIHPEGSSDYIVLSFRDPRRLNPFNVRGITGLDADEIVARYYGISATKKKYYTLSMERREPVVQIELNPRFTEEEDFSDLRDIIYKMIASSRTGIIEIQFKNGTEVVATLSGFVSKVENSLFEKIQGVSVTIKTNEPMLKAPTRTEIDILTLDLANSNIQDLKSTAPHGFIFEVGFLTGQSSFRIEPPDDAWAFNVVYDFLSGDVLHFSSELNNKYLFVRRAGTNIYLADKISTGSIWPILFPGDNIFQFANPTNMVWEAASYYATYWGV